MLNSKIIYIEKNQAELISLWNETVSKHALAPQALYQWKPLLDEVYHAESLAIAVINEKENMTGFALVYFNKNDNTLYSCRHGFFAENNETAETLKQEVIQIARKYNLSNSVITSGNIELKLENKLSSKQSLYLPVNYENEESLWLSVPKKTKNMIRKAEKSGLEITSDWSYLKDFYHLYTDRFSEKSLGIKPFSHFEKIKEKFKDDILFLGALHNKKLVAGMIFISAGQIISYAYNASNLDASNNGANNLIMWYAMQHYSVRNGKFIDLSESKPDSPVYNFKMRLSKDIQPREIFYYDLTLGMGSKQHKNLKKIITGKFNGLLNKLLPLMPLAIKKAYLEHLGAKGRII